MWIRKKDKEDIGSMYTEYACICTYACIDTHIGIYIKDGISRLFLGLLRKFLQKILICKKMVAFKVWNHFTAEHLGIDFDHLQRASLMDPYESKIRVWSPCGP